MTRWEYCELDLGETSKHHDEIDLLNRAGSQGWELVAVLPPVRALMKRPVAPISRPRTASSQATSADVRGPK